MTMSCSEIDANIQRAAEAIESAEALLIGAGAGMGVDSGLPDFRGPEGFWKAYPPFRGRSFAEMSTPHWFETDPQLAWGFFGHRLNLYRNAAPHAGFAILRKWMQRPPYGSFVFTSNVDGQFLKAGFDESLIVEYHGSIHHLQCSVCNQSIWSAAEVAIDVDESTIRARSELPRCPSCAAIARPNILMFGDWGFSNERHTVQNTRYREWLRQVRGRRIVVVEMGAGLGVPTVRLECESEATVLIRINPREPETPDGGISLPLGARDALERIDQALV